MSNNKYMNLIISVISIIAIIEGIILVMAIKNKTEAVALDDKFNIIKMISQNTKAVISEKYETNSKSNLTGENNGNTENTNPNVIIVDANQNKEEPKEFYIKVNYQENVVTIYIKDENGNFTVPYKAMICSTGVSTPTGGVYKMSDRGKWGAMVGNVWAQYYSRINGYILFHSVPYTKKSPSTLEYWEYDKLGTSASAGCVRLTVEDAKWIYEHCLAGTQVEFYADSDPGPLGKPTASKIAESSESVRGWDPTDPDENNPWRYY